MGRRSRRTGRWLPVTPPRPVDRVESWSDEEWVVRRVSGAAAVKVYRCPGCDHEIAVGVPHVVAWPRHAGLTDRRHWHDSCWQARDRRRPHGS